MIADLTNHLWQSTLFAIAAGILAIALRNNRAPVRFWLWFSASLKFLVPFALLMSLGSHLKWAPAAAGNIAPPAISFTMVQVAQPFTSVVPSPPSTPDGRNWTTIAMLAVWACGFAAIALVRFRGWLRIRAAVRSSSPSKIAAAVPVRYSPTLLEPGVVGLLRPILLLPAGIEEHLTEPQLEAVLAHELCHVRRRDNVTSAIHMLVEAIFWFHPLVWWIGAKLVEERENACDEEVLRVFGEPQTYAEGILNVCKLYLESPLVCVSGVTGADLRKRIETIMDNRSALQLNLGKKMLLAAAGMLAATAPLMVGLLKAQSETPLAFEVASVKPHPMPVGFVRRPWTPDIQCPGIGHCGVSGDRFTEDMASLADLVMDAYGVRRYQISGLPNWGDSGKDVFDIAAKVEGGRTPTLAQARRMLQTLLADRFQLKLHHETKILPVYDLVIAKNGPKLVLVPPEELGKLPPVALPSRRVDRGDGGSKGGSGGRGAGRGRALPAEMAAFERSWDRVAEMLSMLTSRPVIDKTGFAGTYRTLDGQDPMTALNMQQLFQEPETTFTQVQEKWGLKLESQKGPVDILVIDHVEKPSGN